MSERQDGAAMSGPYDVAVWAPCPEGHKEPVMQGDGHGWDGSVMHTPPCEVCDDRCEVLLSRVAVGSLEEARESVRELIRAALRGSPFQRADALNMVIPAVGASGGSVSLPDGTRIDVQATTYNGLAADCGWQPNEEPFDYSSAPRHKAEVLAAWNEVRGL